MLICTILIVVDSLPNYYPKAMLDNRSNNDYLIRENLPFSEAEFIQTLNNKTEEGISMDNQMSPQQKSAKLYNIL